MKLKKLAVGVLVAALVAAIAAPALAAALNQDQANELLAIQKQMAELRKQMIDKLVAYGRITPQVGEEMKARIDARLKYMEEHPDWYQNCPFGEMGRQGKAPRRGSGAGMRGGFGLGLGLGNETQ